MTTREAATRAARAIDVQFGLFGASRTEMMAAIIAREMELEQTDERQRQEERVALEQIALQARVVRLEKENAQQAEAQRGYAPLVAERDRLAEANRELVEALEAASQVIRGCFSSDTLYEIGTLTKVRAVLAKHGGKT